MLKLINRCPACSTAYDTREARLFQKTERATLLHLTCTGCQSFFIAMVVKIGAGMGSLGMITDLSFDDIKRLYRTPEISTDELIAGYLWLQQPGNVINSFSRGPARLEQARGGRAV